MCHQILMEYEFLSCHKPLPKFCSISQIHMEVYPFIITKWT